VVGWICQCDNDNLLILLASTGSAHSPEVTVTRNQALIRQGLACLMSGKKTVSAAWRCHPNRCQAV